MRVDLGMPRQTGGRAPEKWAFFSRRPVKWERGDSRKPSILDPVDVTSHCGVTLPRVLARMPNGARQTRN
jgi:hypothetical protein